MKRNRTDSKHKDKREEGGVRTIIATFASRQFPALVVWSHCKCCGSLSSDWLCAIPFDETSRTADDDPNVYARKYVRMCVRARLCIVLLFECICVVYVCMWCAVVWCVCTCENISFYAEEMETNSFKLYPTTIQCRLCEHIRKENNIDSKSNWHKKQQQIQKRNESERWKNIRTAQRNELVRKREL